MLQGQSLSATLPEESGLRERFWYWHGASGQRYIHSVYQPDLCPMVAGAVFVVVRVLGGSRQALAVGRFNAEGKIPGSAIVPPTESEVHIHLLARDDEGAQDVLYDLVNAMKAAPQRSGEIRQYSKPVQLELLAA